MFGPPSIAFLCTTALHASLVAKSAIGLHSMVVFSPSLDHIVYVDHAIHRHSAKAKVAKANRQQSMATTMRGQRRIIGDPPHFPFWPRGSTVSGRQRYLMLLEKVDVS